MKPEIDAQTVATAVSEFAEVDLGDKRLDRRLWRIVAGASASPDDGFPAQAGSDSALEGTYRFFNNEKVEPEAILSPHMRLTVQRCGASGRVLALHDTTEFRFPGQSDRGLGTLSGGGQGFFGHFALGVTADGERRPLGILGLQTVFRPPDRPTRLKKARVIPWGEKESARWLEVVLEVAARLDKVAEVVHVMDREGDSYELLSGLHSAGQRFVVRSRHDRVIAELGRPPHKGHHKRKATVERLWDVLAAADSVAQRTVPLTARQPQHGQRHHTKHANREERLASLRFSAISVIIERPPEAPPDLPDHLPINAVRAWEPNPPGNETPIEWRLLTSEPVDTPERILEIIDTYRARWVIEEFFKALKTGCAYEKRQLESPRALLNALAVLAPVAWRLLLLRSLARDEPDTDASAALTRTQVAVMVTIAKGNSGIPPDHPVVRALTKAKFSKRPTVKEALAAIASLGGHLKQNGPPGWQTLGKGYECLLMLELGWILRGESSQ